MDIPENFDKLSPEKQVEYAAYREDNVHLDVVHGGLYVPGEAVRSTLVAAAKFSKGRGRSTLQTTAAACLMVEPEHIYLGTDKYEIDSRWVVNPPTGGRVIRHRPKLNRWKITFVIKYDDNLLKAVQVRRIVDDGGALVGLLDFRPACKGPFGRYIVEEWREI